MLPADRQRYLRHQSAGFDVRHATDKLIAPADTAKVCSSFCDFAFLFASVQKLVHFFFGDSVVATRRLYRANLALINPLLQSWVADPQHLRRLARREQFVFAGHEEDVGASLSFPARFVKLVNERYTWTDKFLLARSFVVR